MKYRHKFIIKLRKEFPDCNKLQELLDEGSVYLGDYLKKKTLLKLTPEEVLSAFRTGQERLIKEKAQKAMNAQRLYDEWNLQYERAVESGQQREIEIIEAVNMW